MNCLQLTTWKQGLRQDKIKIELTNVKVVVAIFFGHGYLIFCVFRIFWIRIV
ncbi:hypothetical protein BD408DRAFT_415166, partial [Parasitella parasitica]